MKRTKNEKGSNREFRRAAAEERDEQDFERAIRKPKVNNSERAACSRELRDLMRRGQR